jgi:ATP-dependent DNA helicase RecG
LTPEELKILTQVGENQTAEFKADISTSPARSELESIGRHFVALTNTEGGKVLFGVEDNGDIVGVRDKRHIEDTLSSLVRDAIDPPITPPWEWVRIEDHDVLVVMVKKFSLLDYPRRSKENRTYFIRVGRHSREATHQEVRELFIASTGYKIELNPEGGIRFG